MKVFYTNYATDKGIDSENAIEIDTQSVVDIFLDLVDSEDSFLGLVDENNNVIQFSNEENQWLLDIPNPPNFKNMQAYLKDTECLNLIVEILNKNKIKTNMKLYEVNIMEETLSEVLERKG
ncbi:hypothetical protein EGM88_12590 [Aureibaculum marinum]|uniref:Uncharacterized protein n=1 Tax=Aureibaculum marinum TaxID=2487930 RepID=A0A3N4NIS8_9FLAO|nr:hypothetical protein [Aureibaculum marinum]RPD94297.1 hypothetical protein EGM88_12590 [Aureibaculum marinum]